jgi:hypothetical protein
MAFYKSKKMSESESYPSLCIPYVFSNITENRIRRVFDELRIGKIKRVDILQRKNSRGQKYQRVFIHFHKWYNGNEAQEARTRVITGKDIKIVYDNPWFWKVSANKWTEPKPHICFDEEEEEEEEEEERPIHNNCDDDEMYVPDYGNITPPKKRLNIKKRVIDEESDLLYGDLDV